MDNRLRERLLRGPELTLEKLIQIGQAAEQTKIHINDFKEALATSGSSSVDMVRNKSNKSYKKSHGCMSKPEVHIIKMCKSCVKTYKRGSCPAYGRKCNTCHKPNHFAACCKKGKAKHVREVECVYSSDDSSDSEFFIGSISFQISDDEVLDVENGHTDNDNKASQVPPQRYENGSKNDEEDNKTSEVLPQNSGACKRDSEDNDETSEVFSVSSEKLHSDSWI